MRRYLGLVPLFLLFVLIIPAQIPRDVEPTLDVYEQVQRMVQTGIMDVDHQGNFRGLDPINRFEQAAISVRLIDYIMGSGPIKDASGLSLRVARLEQSIEQQKTSIDTLRRRLETLEFSLSREELDALEFRLNRMKDEVLAQMQNLESRTQFISGYSDFLVAVQEELRNLHSVVREQDSRLIANEANVGRLLEYLRQYSTLDTWMPTVDSKLAGHDSRLGELRNQMLRLEERIKTVEQYELRLNTLEMDYRNLLPVMDQAKKVPQIQEALLEQEKRLYHAEVSIAVVNKLQQDVDYLKIENDRIKSELMQATQNYWYAIGLGALGMAVGIGAFLYAFSLSGPGM